MKPYIFFILVLLLATMTSAEDMYNMTEMDNADNIYEYILALDSTILVGVPNPVGIIIIIIVFALGFIVNSVNSNGSLFAGLLAGSFIASLTGIILLPLQLLSFDIYVVVLIITAISVFVSLVFGKGGG